MPAARAHTVPAEGRDQGPLRGDAEGRPVSGAVGLEVGQVLRESRTVRDEDIVAFADLVGDRGRHHLPDQGRAMAHGLFTASLATRIGGRVHFIARRMSWEFLRPVWSGDTITAEVTVRALSEARSGTALELDIEIVNQDGETVLRGESTGLIRH
ncbi:hotdog domain-containing protein [Streptomyces sp. NPDC053431]|uniref:hotdog domain-containing protein n=1 Tax=Streptomyces sp. NPDC053431 TaxID=3365703 RepID=UPI0037CE8669